MKISEQRWEATEAFDGDMHIGAFVTCDDEEICLADTAELANAIAHLPDCVRLLKAGLETKTNDTPGIAKHCEKVRALLREIGEE